MFILNNFDVVLNIKKIANIHYFDFINGYHTKKDSHDFYELVYVDNGRINISSDCFNGIISKNQLIIHSPNEIHSLTCFENESPSVIIIGFKCDNKLIDEFSKGSISLSPKLQQLLAEIIKESRNVYLPPYDVPYLSKMQKRDKFLFGSDQLLKNLLESFFIKLIREKMQTPSPSNAKILLNDLFVQEIINYIDNNLSHKFCLEELCVIFSTNKTTLCSRFKNAVGQSIIEYVNTEKIKFAKRLIRQGNHTVSQISTMLSFSSIHYFTNLFKKYNNMSPTNYAKLIEVKYK